MPTIKKRTAIASIIIGLVFIGSSVWPLLSHASAPAAASTLPVWSASIKENQSLPALAKDGRDAMTASYAFWGGNWLWANPSTNFNIVAPYQYAVTGSNKMLDFDLNGKISAPSGNQLV